MKTKKTPETVLLRIEKGALVPDDNLAVARLRARGFQVGDVVTATLRKPRNPKFHRLVHRLGALLVENLDAFSHLNAHEVLKRLQIESGIGCDGIGIYVPGVGMCEQRVPRSLSFENMDEAEFQELYKGLCQHIIKIYWPTLDADQIDEMASLVGMAA